MEIRLYHNNSPNNKIGKDLSSELPFSGSLRNETEIIKPEILIEASDLTGYNYAFIPVFNRYYFVEDIVSYRTGLWNVKLGVDVLESYKNEIKNLDCIIEATEGYGADDYLSNSESWVTRVKAKTDIINFNHGLLNNGEYILITAGG